MYYLFKVLISIFVLVGLGCASTDHSEVDLVQEDLNVRIIHALNDAAVKNAIIAQHTLYPYHFNTNSSELNDLGKKDLGVLLLHFKKHPGKMNIHQGNTSNDLYRSRLATVRLEVADAGLDKTDVLISDDLPGGDGISSERAVKILEDGSEFDTRPDNQEFVVEDSPRATR